jgi:biopolymer transport protein ExbD
MNCLKTSNLAGLKNRVRGAAFLVVVTVLSAPRSTAQVLQKGISVEMASTSSAVPVPDADKQGATIITVTETGKLYFGIDMVTLDELAEKLKALPSRHAQSLYIKADAKAPYAYVIKVLDLAHSARIERVTLLANQASEMRSGTPVSPLGIELQLARRAPAPTR